MTCGSAASNCSIPISCDFEVVRSERNQLPTITLISFNFLDLVGHSYRIVVSDTLHGTWRHPGCSRQGNGRWLRWIAFRVVDTEVGISEEHIGRFVRRVRTGWSIDQPTVQWNRSGSGNQRQTLSADGRKNYRRE
jgi:hypothetical protein